MHRDVSWTVYRTRSWSNTLSSAGLLSQGEDEDTINVVVRVRPQSQQDIGRAEKMIIQFPGDGALWIDNAVQTKSFTFNVTFEPEATQEDVFENCGVKKLINMALGGYSCTAFAFGQTGSGKTHTITGPPDLFPGNHWRNPDQYGLIPRSFYYLFHLIEKQAPKTAFRLTASFLEIYNEQVIDLLDPNHRKNLQVRWSKNRGFYVENLFVVECETRDDLIAVLEEGLRNRQTGVNSMNEHSSRSHSMLTLHIDTEVPDTEDDKMFITKHGKLTFVDLAGSEKTKTDMVSTAEQQTESHNINKSLLVLGNCISALGDARKRQGYIPYRDSKLTKLLADSLGGSGVTLMIACISPSFSNATEGMNTLRYANRAKKIKSKPVVKMDPREQLIMSLKREIKILRQENHYLRQQLEFPVKPRGQLQKENDMKFLQMLKDHKMDSKGISDHGLYEMLQEYMIENEILRVENTELHQVRDFGRREQQMLARDNERLMRKLENAMGSDRSGLQTPMSSYSLQSATISLRSSAMDSDVSYGGTPFGGPPQPGSWNSTPVEMATTPRNMKNPAARLQHPMRPPHRLSEPVLNTAANQKPQGYVNRLQQQNDYRTSNPGTAANTAPPGPNKPQRRSSKDPNYRTEETVQSQQNLNRPYSPSSVAEIQEINERLRQELLELEGQIKQQSRQTNTKP
ncbi:Kinesin-like protein KIF12 [Lamellibrachia satsuma]|nr:Kinesin-like protein KIF12 [Lamellibrachia satsuma]